MGWLDDVFSSPTTSMGLQGFGMGMSIMGAINQADQQQAVLDYQSKVAANNAIFAGYQASVAKDVGTAEEVTQRLKTAQLYHGQRAAMAANGIDLGEGNATDILATTKYMGERDALTIRDNTAYKVWALENEGRGYSNQAGLLSSQASMISPLMAGAGSLLTGATSIAQSYYKLKQQGAFD